MKWLLHPEFSEDGSSFTLKQVCQVPSDSIVDIGPASFEELRELWSRND